MLVESAGVSSSFITMWKHSLVSPARRSPFTGGRRMWAYLPVLSSLGASLGATSPFCEHLIIAAKWKNYLLFVFKLLQVSISGLIGAQGKALSWNSLDNFTFWKESLSFFL